MKISPIGESWPGALSALDTFDVSVDNSPHFLEIDLSEKKFECAAR
jgi:hypothetical protein